MGSHRSAALRASARPDGQVVLGLSFDYHDAAAALVVDGELVAAAAEERFTRIKHDPSIPANAIEWCLNSFGVGPGDLAAVAFYSKPLTTYERILATHSSVGVRGFPALQRAVRVWSGSKLWVSYRIERILAQLGHPAPQVYFGEHHTSHAASAFYPSPFERAAVLVFDGVGEWTTSSIAKANGNLIEVLAEQRFPDSLGLFYSAMTAQCGFAVNDGEYKLMGLAPYGDPVYVDRLLEKAVTLKQDGTVVLDGRIFGSARGNRAGSSRLDQLIGWGPRHAEVPVGQEQADLARSAQVILESSILATAKFAFDITGETKACLAGGVALNCVANARLLRDGPFDDIWVQPAAGDDGGAVGAALWLWHQVWNERRHEKPGTDGMSGCGLGPAFSTDEIVCWLESEDINFEILDDEALFQRVATALASANIVGWFRGPMEFGPRALGHRSILADPRDASVVQRLNTAVKGRESFRPFAPAVLAEHLTDWFETTAASPFMTFTAEVKAAEVVPPEVARSLTFGDHLVKPRSKIPACTHVDLTARLQTVDQQRSPDLHQLMTKFFDRTGCPVLVNTSFNRAGEPIVRSPADAMRTFTASGIDLLVLENVLVLGDRLENGDVESRPAGRCPEATGSAS